MTSHQKTALQLEPSERTAYSKLLSGLSAQCVPTVLMDRADAVARKIALILRAEFGAKSAWVFGSLANRTFSTISDIDIAYQGMVPELYFSAYVAISSMAEGFNVDLVDIDNCEPELRKEIMTKGIAI